MVRRALMGRFTKQTPNTSVEYTAVSTRGQSFVYARERAQITN